MPNASESARNELPREAIFAQFPSRLAVQAIHRPYQLNPTSKKPVDSIISSLDSTVDIAISICLYCLKAQLFNDGNKRAAVIFANHYLISHGGGLLVIPEHHVPEFKRLLVLYYEDHDKGEIREFMKNECIRKI